MVKVIKCKMLEVLTVQKPGFEVGLGLVGRFEHAKQEWRMKRQEMARTELCLAMTQVCTDRKHYMIRLDKVLTLKI